MVVGLLSIGPLDRRLDDLERAHNNPRPLLLSRAIHAQRCRTNRFRR
jgi:hypothetical protein